MAKVRLDIETDFSQVAAALSKGEQLIQETGVEIQEFGADAKTAYTSATKEANKYNKELTTATKQTVSLEKETKKIEKSKSYIQQLKAEIKLYTSEAAKAGEGTKAFAENLEKAGKLKDELADLNAAVNALNGNLGENLARAGGETISLLATGYEGLIATQNLLGVETDNYEKALLKLQSIQSIANVAKEFAGIKDKLTEIKLGFKPVVDLYTNANESLKNFFRGFKEGREDVEDTRNIFEKLKSGVTDFVNSGKTSIKSLWTVIKANPLGVILTILGSVIATLVALKDKVKPIGDAFNALGKIAESILEPFKKLAEILGLAADESERRARATISATEKEIEAIKKRYDTEISLLEISGKYTGTKEKEKYEAVKKRAEQTKKLLEDMLGSEMSEADVENLKKQNEIIENAEIDLTKLKAREEQKRTNFQIEMYEENDRLRIAAIKDDEQRELEQAFAKRRIALKLYNDKINLLFDEKEKSEIMKDAEIYAEQNYQNQIGLIRKKYSEKRTNEEKAYQDELAKIRETYAKKRAEEAKKRAEEERKNLEKLKALQKEFADAFLEILRKVDTARISQLTGEDRIKAERDLALKELEILRQGLIAKGQAEENFNAELHKRKAKNFELTIEQQRQFDILQQQIFADSTQKLIALEVERQNAIAKAKAENSKIIESTLETQQDSDIAAVKSMSLDDNNIRNQIEFEKQKQIAILNIELEYSAKRLEAKKKSLQAEREETLKSLNGELAIIGDSEDKETQAKRSAIIERLDLLEKQYIAQSDLINNASAAEIQSLKTQLQELNRVPPIDLAKLLGLNGEEFDKMKSAFSDIRSEIQNFSDGLFDYRNAEIDAEINKNEKIIAERDKNIADLEKKVEQQKKLSEDGLANSLDSLTEQLTTEQKLRDDAISAQKQQQIEKAELAKKQLQLDTIIQASNVAVAVSEVLETYAAVPYAAAALAAVIVGAFAVQKAAAFKVANNNIESARNFKDGVIDIQGPGTTTSDSIKANISRGESVMTAKETQDNLFLFKGIRFKNKALIEKGIMDLLENTGVTLSADLPQKLVEKKNQIRAEEIKISLNSDYSELKREQEETNKRLDKLIEANNSYSYKDQNGSLIQKTGNHTVITRKKQ